MNVYVVFPHVEGRPSVFPEADISRGNTLTQEIRKRGGTGDEYMVLTRATAAEALREGSTYLIAAPQGRQQGRVVRPIPHLHLVPCAPK